MLTFCFTMLAAANLRPARKVLNSNRMSAFTTQTARVGLASMVILAAAGFAHAGGFGSKSFGGSSGNGNNGSSNRLVVSNNNQTNSTPKFDFKKPVILNSQNNTMLPITKNVINTFKPDKLTPKNTMDLKVKIDPKLIKSDKLFKTDKLVDKNFLKDKKFDKCHDHCFHHCPWWYCWNYPIWCPLYGCGCGYWYEVPVVEIREGVDLQLLAVRMIDSGDPEQNLGPAFRVWVRNNSPVAIVHPFNVLALAARTTMATSDLPQAGVRVDAIAAGEIVPVDVRLPAEANQPGFPMLHVLVDSHREIVEVFENNNGTVLNRAEIPAVDATPAPVAVQTTAEANLPLVGAGVN